MTRTADSSGVLDGQKWESFAVGEAFSCDVAIVREADGYSVHATALPGVVSEGDTIDGAIENIRDALKGALTEYVHAGHIPWRKIIPEGEVVAQKRILVNV
jgi:predicted RNase H-like HicB family nuclease